MLRCEPQISVIMPVYNCEAFLADAISSILKQSYRDFELIIMDDGSTDASLLIAQKFASSDPRVKIHSLSHLGLASVLNFGISICSGQYIARMDADDVATSRRFELQLAQLNKTNADLCGGAIETFGNIQSIRTYPEAHAGCVAMALFESPLAHPTVIGKSQLFKALQYDVNSDHCEDYDLWVRAIKAGYTLTNVQAPVLMYRVHSNQVSFKHGSQQNETARGARQSMWTHLLPELGGAKQQKLINEASGKNEIHSLNSHFVKYAISHSTVPLAEDTLYYFIYKCFIKSRSRYTVVGPHFLKITFNLNVKLNKKLYLNIVLFVTKTLGIHSSSWHYHVLKRSALMLTTIWARKF